MALTALGLIHIDTFLMKFSLAFSKVIDKIIACWCGSLANYSIGGYFVRGGKTAFEQQLQNM